MCHYSEVMSDEASAISAASQLLHVLIMECNRMSVPEEVRDRFVAQAEMKLEQVKYLSAKNKKQMFGQLKACVQNEARDNIHEYALTVPVEKVMSLLHLGKVQLPEAVGTPAVRSSLLNLVMQCT